MLRYPTDDELAALIERILVTVREAISEAPTAVLVSGLSDEVWIKLKADEDDRDGSWPERITPDRRSEFIKELATLSAWLRTLRDLVEAYSALERLAANESIFEPSTSLM